MTVLAMSSPTLTQRYFDAWNDHDADAVVACFAPGGTYSDPAAGDGLTGEAIAAHARALWDAFPDLRFEIASANACGANRVAVQWVMRGTNLGAFRGHASTGRALALPGAGFIQLAVDGIRSVQGYFDSGAVERQLDLAAAAPAAIGPFSFGAATRVQSGRQIRPGAITVTSLRARAGGDAQAVREGSFEIAQDLLGRPGFIGLLAAAAGQELTTVIAWDSIDAVRQLRDPRHGEVMAQFLGPELCPGGTTTVWAPVPEGAVWVRCTACGAMADGAFSESSCDCGALLPEAAAAW